MFTQHQLKFIARYLLVPQSIENFVTKSEPTSHGYKFELEGEEYEYDHWDVIHSKHNDEETPTIEFMLRVIAEYDPEHESLINHIGGIFEMYCDTTTKQNITDFTIQIIELFDHINTLDDIACIDITTCEITFVKEVLDLISKITTQRISKTMSKSLTKFNLQIPDEDGGDGLIITKTLSNNYEFRAKDVMGTYLVLNKHTLGDEYSSFTIVNDIDSVVAFEGDWDDESNDDEQPNLIITMNIATIFVGIRTLCESGLIRQEDINSRNHFDVIVYDSQDADSLLGAGMSVQHMHKSSNFDYAFINRREPVNDINLFKGLRVCFINAFYDAPQMRDIIDIASTVITFSHISNPKLIGCSEIPEHVEMVSSDNYLESIVPTIWDYYIGKPRPFTINIFAGDEVDYLVKYIRESIINITPDSRYGKTVSFIRKLIGSVNDGTKYPEELIEMIDNGKVLLGVTDDESNITDTRIEYKG